MTDLYEEKPKQVEAEKFDGSSEEMMAVVTWVEANGYTWFDTFTPAPAHGVSMDSTTGFLLLVDSDGRLASARKGQWIIKQPSGDFTVMSDDEFNATYQLTTPV